MKSMIRSRLSRHQLLTVLFCTISLGGCANSLPFFSEMMPDSAPMITGSIFAPAATLSTELNSADWEKANQALGTALRPENIHEPVQWENKTTAARGNFRPIGIAFLQEGDLCRAFSAQIVIENVVRPAMQGTACRSGASEWKISEVKQLVKQG
jgi:surface antigen